VISIFSFSSPNLSGQSLDVYVHTVYHTTWCGLSANLRRRSETGGLKTRDRKTRHSQNCRTGKRGTGKRATKLQDWKTQHWKTRHQTAGLENARKGMYGKPNCVLHM